jgi:hypothetical protein
MESKLLRARRSIPLLENCIFYISPMYEFSHRLGQTRSFGDVSSMSALPESGRRSVHCDVAKSAITSREQMQQRCRSNLLDHLVGAGEQRRWHFEAD